MNRALRAATLGVLLISPLALSACGAGQVTQTASQVRDKVGAMAEVGDLTLRAVEFAYPRGSRYEEGDDADLRLVISNASGQDDTLVGISGEGFGDVEFDTEQSSGGAELEIPAGQIVVVDGEETGISLTGLEQSLTAGQALDLTFTFENAGEVTVPVPVSAADEAREREEGFDFHHSEEGEEAEGDVGTGEQGAEDQREGSG